MKPMSRLLLMCLAALLTPIPAMPQHDHSHEDHRADPSAIGTVHFDTSCKAEVKDTMDRAVALLHSFWFGQARDAFEQVLRDDPTCAIAYWGIALTHWGNPFAGMHPPESIALGQAAISQARSIGARTPRERAYIDAAGILFAKADRATQTQRIRDYEAAMKKLAQQYPEDTEAKIFAALAVAQAAEPDDKTYARQIEAGAILEPLFERMPQHPGLAHYIIHAYDVPPLAAKALPAARTYADIAPAIPHALHMPSHTFTRVGMWRESVATNLRSAQVAEANREPGAVLHALDYMTYAYLQMAMDEQALDALAWMKRTATSPDLANSFAGVAMPARYALEREQWQDAARLPIPSVAPPFIEAMARFARAVGAARSGNPAAATPDIERLAALRDRTKEMNDAYWAEIIDIQRRGAQAWQSFAQGDRAPGIATMRAAADAEDATDKSVVTPGPLAPAREMLGYMLLEADQLENALAEFEKVIAKEPHRFLALYGAGRAAERAGKAERAKEYFNRIVAICSDARGERPALAYARKAAD
jgi:hypothetical protein